MRDLEGKLVLITGGARGVGKVIARQFADRGARLLINFFHSLAAAKETKAELEAAGATVDLIRASVAQRHQVDRMFEEIEAKYGYLDILVNNAAAGAFVPVGEIDEEQFARALDTNLKGAFWCSRAAARLIATRGGGSIVNVSSVGAGLVPANYLVVGTSKAALEALTRYLAVEFAPSNIRVNTASASMVDGEVAKLFPGHESMRAASIGHTPLARLATAEDLAGLVMFLTSKDSSFVTGQTILADGGLSLNHVALSPSTEGTREPEVAVQSPESPVATPVSTPAGLPTPSSAAGLESDDIAIVGMGLVVPGASSPQEFWRALMDRPELFDNVPADRWDYRSFYSPDQSKEDKTYQSRSAFITDWTPAERVAREMRDRVGSQEFTTLWLRHSLVQALDGVKRTEADRWSFTVGYTPDGSQHLEEAMVLAGTLERLERLLPGLDGSPSEKADTFREIRDALEKRYWRAGDNASEYLPHNVGRNAMAGVLPAGTELMMVDTACSSSLYAVDIGIKGLLTGKQDIAVCGGSFALAPRGSVLFAKLHGLSVSGEVRPLDKGCDGVLFSDGAGVVVLKRLTRALADGDRVLALVRGFGSSSDGKGKAIYAPSAAGQSIAIERALSDAAVDVNRIQWVVAHATGTPAGDLAEMTTLCQKIVADHPVYVTSNKSLIGHTGWAAGVASLIQVVLGLQHETIPPQHRFTAPQESVDIGRTVLQIPTTPIAWPKKAGDARVASVSGFGFGGTNAHLIVEEYVSGKGAPAQAPVPRQRLAIVGWSAHLPGFDTRAQIESWASGQSTGQPAQSFGDAYPLPPFEKARMPKGTLRALDRCQLMVLECAHQLKSELTAFWDANTETIGVFMGHMGATRNAALYGARCYLDDIATAVAGSHPTHGAIAQQALTALREDVHRLVLPSNENSFPGMMPNVIPARIANYFDLKGLNMTVDTGYSSAISSFEVAGRYLRTGELTMALVGAVNGNVLPEISHLLSGPRPILAEGAFLFAVTTEETAAHANLPVLAFIEADATIPAAPRVSSVSIECGSGSMRPNYLGAEGARGLLEAIATRASTAAVICRDADGHPAQVMYLEAAKPIGDGPVTIEQPTPVPEAFLDPARREGTALEVERYEAGFFAHTSRRVRPELPFLPAGTVVLTNRPERLRTMTLPPGAVVLSTEPFSDGRPGWILVPELTDQAIGGLLEHEGISVSHLRVVTDLQSSSGAAGSVYEEPASLVALHDLTFLVLKHAFDRLAAGDSSIVGLFLDAVPNHALHPLAGLFSGLLKSATLELPRCVTAGVFTTEPDLDAGIRQAVAETSLEQYLPVVLYDGGTRKTLFVDRAAGVLPADGAARLGPEAVVVAVGGARGITAELMKAVTEHFRPTVYLMGSNRLDQYPREMFEESDRAFTERRHAYLREQKARHPGRPLGVINKDFDRMVEARTAHQNIAVMRRHSGEDRVHYVPCNVLDRDRVSGAVKAIVDRHGRIDLLVNAAGLNRSGSIPLKSLEDFRTVRDIKLRGYQNLKYALRHAPPRMWCNFGSFIGLTGQLGETDYASANDFLATSAAYARTTGLDEFTIGWTLWSSVGLGANPVTKAFLEKSGLFTSMSTETGIHHFIREINLPSHAPSVVHLGTAERKAITDHIPQYFTARERTSTVGGFYLGRTLAESDGEILIERVFDLQADAYLAHHLVNGYATLPGTFVPELAAEAASRLVPGMKVIRFEDAIFHHFLRVYEKDRPSPKKIHARVVRADAGETVVQVRVLTDIIGPGGRLLQKDKLHFEIKAILAAEYPAAPVWERWTAAGEVAVTDPYHVPAAPVLLKGPFVSTRHTCEHPLGKTAVFDLKVRRDDEVFSRFLVPSILLDGLARVAVLTYVHGEYIPLAAPAAIRRIDIYEAGNDCDLAERYSDIRLYATPRDLSLEDASKRNRFVAARPDGRMLMQMKDVRGIVIGYVHRDSGAYATPEEMNRVAELAASGQPAGGR
jgi:NAD(P)-dependent dehydrogenase (short-subunit alcohol dehydrogenase family)/3-oxoacyl-(acyl-carrier-protein) synthase